MEIPWENNQTGFFFEWIFNRKLGNWEKADKDRTRNTEKKVLAIKGILKVEKQETFVHCIMRKGCFLCVYVKFYTHTQTH